MKWLLCIKMHFETRDDWVMSLSEWTGVSAVDLPLHRVGFAYHWRTI